MGPGQQPWHVLSALPAWQLTEIPRAPQRPGEGGPDERPAGDGAVQRAAELVSAYCRGAPVAVAWVRERAGGPVRVITAGPALAAATDHGQDVLTLPAGARGQPLPVGEAARLLAAIGYWAPLAGVCDVLLAGQDAPGLAPAGRDGRPSLEDGLLSAWLGPFGWLLLAEPAGDGTLEELTSEAALAQLEAQRSDSPRAKLAERRAAARHQELRQAASTGLWRVTLLAGGATPEQAAQVAGLLRASSDLTGLPYALLPARPAAPPSRHDRDGPARRSLMDDPALQWAAADGRQRAAAMSPYQPAPAPVADGRWPEPQPAAPFYGSTALVAALARVPAREVPGLRMVLRPQFDLTPETAPAGAGGGAVRVGEVLDWNRVPCGDLAVPAASLNRHVFVCGATGAGKSQTVRNLLEQATEAGIPWLVVEPAKAEYRLTAARLPGTLFRVPGLRVAALAPDPRQPWHPFSAAGYWQVSAQICLGCTFGGPSMDLGWRLRWSPRAVQAMMTRTRLRRPGAPGRWRTTTVRIESACQPRSATTAEPITDDSSTARLLPATIALRNHIGRGPCDWSRPIGPNDRPPTSDRRASKERARPQNRDKPGT